MSVTFRAILNRGIQVELRPGAPKRLSKLTDEIIPSLTKLGHDGERLRKANWEWGWNSDVDADFASWLAQPYVEMFFGEPPIVALGSNSKLCVVNLAVSWIAFTASAEIQEEVRSLIHCIGRSLSADSAIYVPDSGWRVAEKAVENIEGGLNFEECIKLLMSELQATGSFSNLPRTQCVKTVCSAWPIFFDRWEIEPAMPTIISTGKRA